MQFSSRFPQINAIPLLQFQGILQSYWSCEEAYAGHGLSDFSTVQPQCNFRKFIIPTVLRHGKGEGVNS